MENVGFVGYVVKNRQKFLQILTFPNEGPLLQKAYCLYICENAENCEWPAPYE
jgi:hypothetical protein